MQNASMDHELLDNIWLKGGHWDDSEKEFFLSSWVTQNNIRGVMATCENILRTNPTVWETMYCVQPFSL